MKFTIIQIEMESHINTDVTEEVINKILNDQVNFKEKFDKENYKNYLQKLSEDSTLLKILYMELNSKIGNIEYIKSNNKESLKNGGELINQHVISETFFNLFHNHSKQARWMLQQEEFLFLCHL